MNLSERMLHVADKWQERKYPADAVGGLRGYSAEVAQLQSSLTEARKHNSELRGYISLAPVSPHQFVSDYEEWLKECPTKPT